MVAIGDRGGTTAGYFTAARDDGGAPSPRRQLDPTHGFGPFPRRCPPRSGVTGKIRLAFPSGATTSSAIVPLARS